MLRIFDLLISIIGLILAFPIFCLIFTLCMLDTGSPLFFQTRVGRFEKHLVIVKFRTMRLETESLATHLVDMNAVTKLGRILRRTKLDELPQLYNVLCGQMSLVGPRPGLENQHELILERRRLNVHLARPGITGLAQVRGIDMSTPSLVAKADAKLLSHLSVCTYIYYIFSTLFGRKLLKRFYF